MFWPKVNRVYVSVLTEDILLFMSGAALSWSSPEVLKLSDPSTTPFKNQVTSEELSWIASLLILRAAIGPACSGYLADRIGRKPTILSLAFLTGIGMGGSFATIPLYISESALKSQRGGLGATSNTALCLGYLFSYALGPYVSVTTFNLVSPVFPAIFLALLFTAGVECPYYAVERELLNIKENIRELGQGTLFLFFRSRATVKALIIASGLLMFQGLTGVVAVLSYSQSIFEQAEANISADLCTIVIGLVQFVTSVFTPFIADKIGRKTILTVTNVGMSLCLATLGIYSILKEQVCNIGIGPLPWVIMGEIFALKIKFKATFIAAFLCLITAFFITKYLDFMIQSLGMGQTFLIFACFCLLAALFTQFVVVETRGKQCCQIGQNSAIWANFQQVLAFENSSLRLVPKLGI